ncbi:MAG: hypothetical protein JSU93_03570 [Methanobacteriota archaeon]|nr:MAG: hypothetical protein JSU93_03570 [Euryarchaeota archaeon]
MLEITNGDLAGLLGVYGYIAVVLTSIGLLGPRLRNPRKVLHILTGGIVFFWWSFDSREVMAGAAAFPFLAILLLASPISPIEPLKRTMLGRRTDEGHSYGLVMYAASWTLIAYFLFDHLLAASIAIAAMSFGDGMGELVGRRYGRIEYLRHRTLEGTITVFASVSLSVIVLVWFYCNLLSTGCAPPDDTLLFALAVAAFVSCLEAISPGSVDNLTVPLITGGYLVILGV